MWSYRPGGGPVGAPTAWPKAHDARRSALGMRVASEGLCFARPRERNRNCRRPPNRCQGPQAEIVREIMGLRFEHRTERSDDSESEIWASESAE